MRLCELRRRLSHAGEPVFPSPASGRILIPSWGTRQPEVAMRQALLGIVGVLAAGLAHADESYTFTAFLQKLWSFQTTIYCVEPVKFQDRVPQRGCVLSERAIAYPNLRNVRSNTGV